MLRIQLVESDGGALDQGDLHRLRHRLERLSLHLQRTALDLQGLQVGVAALSMQHAVTCKDQGPLAALDNLAVRGTRGTLKVNELPGLRQGQALLRGHSEYNLTLVSVPNGQHGVLQLHVIRDVQHGLSACGVGLESQLQHIRRGQVEVLRPFHRQPGVAKPPGLVPAQGFDPPDQCDTAGLIDAAVSVHHFGHVHSAQR